MSAETDDLKQCKVLNPEPSKNQYALNEFQLGIWKVSVATQIRTQGLWQAGWETYSLIMRLVVDVYRISPQLICLLLVSNCWNGVKSALEMRLDNILLTQVSNTVADPVYMFIGFYRSLGGACCFYQQSRYIHDCFRNWLSISSFRHRFLCRVGRVSLKLIRSISI